MSSPTIRLMRLTRLCARCASAKPDAKFNPRPDRMKTNDIPESVTGSNNATVHSSQKRDRKITKNMGEEVKNSDEQQVTIGSNQEKIDPEDVDSSEVVPADFKRVLKVTDVPKHNLPVKEILGVEPKVWWHSDMSRPSIRQRVFQGDPIDERKPRTGLARLGQERRKKVKKGHIGNLDEMFVKAYEIHGPTKQAFESVVLDFQSKSLRSWGFMEFSFTAIEYMKAFNVQKDVDCYNYLLNTFPRGPLRQVNFFSTVLKLGIHEQQAAMQILQCMHRNGIQPHRETLNILVDVFGPRSDPTQLWRKMGYWLPKFRYLNPYPIPDPLPSNPVDFAKLALLRVSDYDPELTIMSGSYETADVDPAFLVNSQNEEQMQELEKLPINTKVVVEGPFRQYLRNVYQSYFVLRGEAPLVIPKPRTDEIEFIPEDYEDGYVYALGMTGSPNEPMARLWMSELQKLNPNLSNLSVVFNLDEQPTSVVHLSEERHVIDAVALSTKGDDKGLFS